MEPPETPPAVEPSPPPPPPPARPRRRLLGWGLVLLYAASLSAAWLGSRRKDPGSDRPQVNLLGTAKEGRVGWLKVSGPIFADDGGGFRPAGVAAWARRLEALAEKEEVKAIVLEINSPGGSVGAVQEFHSQILRVRESGKKPIIALFSDVAASGGYYIAAACDRIVAHPGTLTGSIGVIFQMSDLTGLLQKVGVKMEPIKSGKHKDIGSATRPMTEEERRLLQALIDDAYGQFFEAVQKGRKIPEEKLRGLADGRIFTGRQALEAGLVDKLGDSQDALALAGELGGIEGKPKRLRAEEPWEDLIHLLELRMAGPAGWAETLQLLPRPGLSYLWTGF